MDSLKMNEVIYKIQDLVIRRKLTSYEKFKTHFGSEIKFDKKLRNHRFINDLFKKIYTFLKVLQKNPKSIILVQALRPLFEMLLNDMIIPKFVRVFDLSSDTLFCKIDLTKIWKYNIRRSKKIVQVGYDLFIDYGDSLEWHEMMDDGMFEWSRDQKTKRIKFIGFEAYIKEKEEKHRKQDEEIEIWKKKEIEEGTYTEEEHYIYESCVRDFCDYSEYNDYLKTTEDYLNEKLSEISEIENSEEQYEEFEKKFEEYED